MKTSLLVNPAKITNKQICKTIQWLKKCDNKKKQTKNQFFVFIRGNHHTKMA